MPLPISYTWVLVTDGASGAGSAIGGTVGDRSAGIGKVGLAVPFSSDGRGRLARARGEDQLRKLILLNLSDLENANPFQQTLGIGADMVFAIASAKLQGELRRRVATLFRNLQLADRAKLSKQPTFLVDSSTQELSMDIDYVNLEENKPDSISVKFAMIPGADPAQAFTNALVGG